MLHARHPWFKNHLDAAVLLMFEGMVHIRAVLKRDLVGDDERRVELALFDPFEADRHVFLHVRLTGADSKSFIHQRTDRDLVADPDVYTGDGYRTALSAAPKHLPEHVNSVRGHKQ